MSSIDREIEKGIESLVRPLLTPPVVYVLAGGLTLGYLLWRGQELLPRARDWVLGHPAPLILVLVAIVIVTGAVLVGVRALVERWRGRTERANLVADWPELAEGLGLPGSAVLNVRSESAGQTVRLQLNRFRGQTSADLVSKLPRLESALRVRPGAVRVVPDAERADLCTLNVIERDPLAKTVPWSPPTVTSVTQPVELGLFEDQRPVELRLWEEDRQRHVLVAGVNGSGKSGLINVALGSLALCQDLVIWGIDLKGGMELAPWHAVLDRLATSPVEAKVLLEAANRALDARTRLLAGRRRRRWQPTPQEPLLLIVVDEISELGPEALALVQRIGRIGRAPGVQLVIATQRPSAQQLESTDESGTALRGQLHTRICMRVTETREADMILGAGLVREGWRADRLLRAPGTFLIYDAPEHVKPEPARCFWMSDQAVQSAVASCQELRPTLDAVTLAAAAGEDPQQQQEPERADVLKMPQDPESRLLALVRSAGPEGMAAAEVASRSGRGRSWTYEALKRLAAQGLVESAKGRWRSVERAANIRY